MNNAPQTTVVTPPTSPKRRGFLKSLSGIATGAVSLSALSVAFSSKAHAYTPIMPNLDNSRKSRSLLVRYNAAMVNYRFAQPTQQSNQDELRYNGYIASFSKGLPHNNLGEVDPNAYNRLLAAIASQKPADYEAIPMGGTVKLANPQAAFTYQLEGLDSHGFHVPAFPMLNSEKFSAELVELYWHALARDVPFSQYGAEPTTVAAINELNRFAAYRGVNAKTLFRGTTSGEANGPLVSQFLWQDVPFGAMLSPQRCKLPAIGDVHMTAYPEWLAVQRGIAPRGSIRYDSTPRYIRNAHDLSEWVHQDFSFQAFQHAALILLSMKAERDNHPYSASKNQAAFITFGAPHILDMLTRACYAGLKAAWYQKWQIHRVLRPEVAAGRLHNHLSGLATYPLHNSLLNAQAVHETYSRFGTYLLPQAFPEGSPTHPSYPAGHAVIAGACVTALKAFFNEDYVLPNPVMASDDGLRLNPYKGNDLTVGGELNKLAGNISFGRDYAGVHYRQDGIQGLLLGEQVTLQLLAESKMLFTEPNFQFRLTKFTGETVSF